MIDVVRLLKNQEMFEIQRAREENREPRVYHGVFSSHPDNDTRLKEVVASAERSRAASNDRQPRRLSEPDHGTAGRCERAQGVTRGTRFYHAHMGFTVAFPTGWHVQNQPAKLVGATPQKDVTLQSSRCPIRRARPRAVPGAESQGNANERGEPLEVNGLPDTRRWRRTCRFPGVTRVRRDTQSST